MRFGMNLLLWTGEMHDGMLPVLEMLKRLGFDGIELPIFNTALNYAEWGRRLDSLGLARTAVTIRGADDNPISPDAAVRARGVENSKKVLDCCAAVGATTLVGPYHSALGVFSGQGPTADEWKWGVDSMRQVAEHAAKVNVTLGVECLNRFETYLLNTHADAAKFCREVAHPNCRMMMTRFIPTSKKRASRSRFTVVRTCCATSTLVKTTAAHQAKETFDGKKTSTHSDPSATMDGWSSKPSD